MKQYKAFTEPKNIKKKVGLFDFKVENIKFSEGKKSIKTADGRKLSSTLWLTRHINDRFTKMSKVMGFSSRASFKLIEIIEKYNLFSSILKSDVILELGCAPGGWTQVLEECIFKKEKTIQQKTKLIALDILPDSYVTNNVIFLQGDFENDETQAQLYTLCEGGKISFILSDIAANSTGNNSVDRLNMIRIVESMIEFCKKHLQQRGCFVFKSLKGCDEAFIAQLKELFQDVSRFKPVSSRKDSSEIYLICQKKK